MECLGLRHLGLEASTALPFQETNLNPFCNNICKCDIVDVCVLVVVEGPEGEEFSDVLDQNKN